MNQSDHRLAELAIGALVKCSPPISLQICGNFLAEHETGGPILGDLMGTVMGDALLWADCAPIHELAAYGGASLDRLTNTRLALGIRKKLFAQLWESFGPDDRKAFLAKVDPNGQFLRRVA